MRRLAAFLFIASIACLAGQPALADKRVAFVIGNSNYQNVGALTNPANDAAAITEMFKKAAFDVVESRRDLKNTEMRRALRDFTEKARDADIAVIYYAGHGIEVDGTNYLIPVDAALERDTDAYDEAIALDRILQAIEPAKQLRLVILDACRDNPFAKSMKRTVASRSLGRGLAGVEPSRPNTLIAFAAKGGSTASDGDSKNSPFTTALLKYLAKPGLELGKAFRLVRDDVMNATANRQEPFVYGSLGGNDVALVPAPAAPTPARRATIRTPIFAAITNWPNASAPRRPGTPSFWPIRPASTPIWPRRSATSSRQRLRGSLRPRRPARPQKSGPGLPPKAPRPPNRPRQRLRRRRLKMRGSRPKRRNRSRTPRSRPPSRPR